MAKKTRKKAAKTGRKKKGKTKVKARKAAKPARKKSALKRKSAPKKTKAKKTRPKSKAIAKKRAKSKPPTIGDRLSNAYHAVVDTVKGTDTLRNKLELPGTSETE